MNCKLCEDSGAVWIEGCNCGGYGSPYYQHEPYCGAEPCPNGCPVPGYREAGDS